MTLEPTTMKKAAHGAYCADCNQFFNITACPYWDWRKSAWMHEGGTGHKVELYKIVVA